ncbi:peptidase S8 [Massilia arenosa]|uniref:Peptidase S8 n=1 Tax=Zemynaea arenosa TaxID=2561931 RepID=A0A4Y9STD6_9BURK|nr:S8 family peptidase [Massilia arenosa]TFW29745.1 peptidase S8 [Massilia arenosa]
MKQSKFVLALCAAAAFTGTVHAGVQQSEGQGHTVRILDTDRLIVKYKDAVPAMKGAAVVPAIGLRQSIIDRAGQNFGVTLREHRTTATGAHVMQLSRRMALADVKALADELKQRDDTVEYAEPDRIMTKQSTPTDPYYTSQWHYFEPTGGINAPAAWDKSTGAGVVVAVIDTGYRPHADLAGQILPGYDFITSTKIANDGTARDSDASDPGDYTLAGECSAGSPAADDNSSWHGTHVAGTIAAKTNNGVGVAGVAYNARILPVRVLGKCGGYTSDIADGMIWASGGTVTNVPANPNKARVLNLSLGGSGACDITTQNAINSARSRGTVVVVAAGNSNVDAVNSNPANCAGVITVAATNRSGGKASYSNYGNVVTVAAPGGDTGGYILSTWNAGTRGPGADNYGYMAGTSMATPHVAGVVALMLSVNPALTPDEVAAKLKSTARPFPASCVGCGAGIVNAAAAVNASIATVSGPTTNEVEPNNSLSQWNAVTTNGVTVVGNLSASTDNDYFMIQVPAGRTLTATLTQGSTTNDFDLTGYDDAGSTKVVSQNGAGLVDSVSLTNTYAKTSPRYIRVRYKSGGTGSVNGKYTLKLTW